MSNSDQLRETRAAKRAADRLDERARRAARQVDLVARKVRRWPYGWSLLDLRNCVVLGPQCDLTAEDIIDYCAELAR